MSSIVIDKTKKSVKQSAKKVVRQLAQEPAEMLKTAKTQAITTKRQDAGVPVVDEILQPLKGQEPTKEEEEQLKAKTKRRTEELENELLKLKRERKESNKEWSEGQTQVMKETDEQVEGKTLIEPVTKSTRGLAGAAAGKRKKKQGTREMAKGPSG